MCSVPHCHTERSKDKGGFEQWDSIRSNMLPKRPPVELLPGHIQEDQISLNCKEITNDSLLYVCPKYSTGCTLKCLPEIQIYWVLWTFIC